MTNQRRQYEQLMIDDIMWNVDGATDGILRIIDYDEDQIRLIGRDFVNALLQRHRIHLNNV